MHASARSYLTAGVAVFGAGAIALAPVQPMTLDAVPTPSLNRTLAVNLAAAIDPITPWIETFKAAVDNITASTVELVAGTGQLIWNLQGYISGITSQVIIIWGDAVTYPFIPNSSRISIDPVIAPSPGVTFSHSSLWNYLETQSPSLATQLGFTTTYPSGVLLGAIGPVVGTVLALSNSITSAITALQSSDIAGAINDVINIPAAMVNAFLNGGPNLDLTGVLTALGVTLPTGVTAIGLAMGGLLSPGNSSLDAGGLPPGFTMFDGMSVTADVGPLSLAVPGQPVGLLGSLGMWAGNIAQAITPVTAGDGAARSSARPTRRAPAAAKGLAKPAAGKAASARSAAASRRAS